MLCSDNRQRWRWLDAMVALTENAMRGSFVPPSSLLSLLYNFIWPMLLKTSGKDRHMRVMEKWERRTWEFQSASCRYKHQALRLKLSPWFLCWILAQLMGDKLSLTTASLSFLSPSGDLGIGLVWDNPTNFLVRLLKSSSNWTKLSMMGLELFSGWYQMILYVFRCSQLFSEFDDHFK